MFNREIENNNDKIMNRFIKIKEKISQFFIKNRRVFVKICVAQPILALVLVGFTACQNPFSKPNSNYNQNDYKVNILPVTTTYSSTKFSFYTSSKIEVQVYYGTYETAEELASLKSMATANQYYPFDAIYNGPYTFFVDYKNIEYPDEIYHYEVHTNQEPIELKEENGKIVWEMKSGYVVNGLAYTYGQTLGYQYGQNYTTIPNDVQVVTPFGNGMHTFQINATDNSGSHYYYMAIDVKGYK